jgi:hypothetical protein
MNDIEVEDDRRHDRDHEIPGDHDDRNVHGDYDAYARDLEEQDDRRLEIEAAVDKAVAAERERAAAELAVLTERMEAAIAEACAAVRVRTIEECLAVAGAEVGAHESKLCLYSEEDSRWVDCNGRANEAVEIYNAIRALAAPTPTTAREEHYTCPRCGVCVELICHCGDGPNDASHTASGYTHEFTPYNPCACAAPSPTTEPAPVDPAAGARR